MRMFFLSRENNLYIMGKLYISQWLDKWNVECKMNGDMFFLPFSWTVLCIVQKWTHLCWLSIIPWWCTLWLNLCIRSTETNVSNNQFFCLGFHFFLLVRVSVCVCVCIFSVLAECSIGNNRRPSLAQW